MAPGAIATIIVPHWASARAYGDLTHQWPPVSEWWPLYLNKEWREKQAAHESGYTCNFDHDVKFVLNTTFLEKFPQYKALATMFVNAVDDTVILLKKI
jgi:hypothetical protein